MNISKSLDALTTSCSRAYGGESAAERDARRRRQLIDAGLQCFGTDGFRATTVRGLCAEAHVAYRSFYDNFDSLEDVLIEVYRECADQLIGAVVGAVGAIEQDMEIEAVITRGLEAYFGVIEDRRLARVIHFEVLGVSEQVDRTYREVLDAFALYFETWWEAWNPGVISETRRGLSAITAVGGLNHLAVVWSLDDYALPRSEVVGAAQQMLLSIASGLGR